MKDDHVFSLPPQLHRTGCALLASGIVRQAVKDWKDAKEMLSKIPDHEPSLDVIRETESFFRSDWFQAIREFAPNVIQVDILEVLNR